ncbi:MAG TPA: hypothetical protein PKI61_00765 [bacterium]|nr:hypothetical protein [bacterium]HPT29416.1 hypothetical protein [bacterium]
MNAFAGEKWPVSSASRPQNRQLESLTGAKVLPSQEQKLIKMGRVEAEKPKPVRRHRQSEKIHAQEVNAFLEKTAPDHDGLRQAAREELAKQYSLTPEQVFYIGSVYDSENPARPNPTVFVHFQDEKGKDVKGFIELDQDTQKFVKFIKH